MRRLLRRSVFVLFAGCALAAAVAAPSVARPLRGGSSAGWVAFSGSPVGYGSKLYLVREDGSDLHIRADGDVMVAWPSWSADGRQIAFSSSDLYDVWSVQFSGGPARKIAATPANDMWPQFVPGPRPYVVWSSESAIMGTSRPHAVDVLAMTGGDNEKPTVSPDGRYVAYQGDGASTGTYAIWLYDFETGSASQLVDTAWQDVSPTWSPDSAHVTFVSRDPTGTPSVIRTTDLSGSFTTVLGPDDLSGPVPYSPNGAWLLLTRGHMVGGAHVTDIYKVRTDGTGLSLVAATGEDEYTPVWNADGSKVVFASTRTDPGYVYKQSLWIVNADGSGLASLVRDWTVAGAPAVSPVR